MNTYPIRMGRLPFASKASKGYTLNFEGRDLLPDTISRYNPLPTLMVQAIRFPGVRQSYFFEKNGYEYERHAFFNKKAKIMFTNMTCPYYYNHHVGSTCPCCGMRD